MRLHRLEITAFGPFAGTVSVDFDELSAGGLFLLTGATGAGKTSVLDAVCFALYGQVPGDRSGARHLRSDHAARAVAPCVVLEVSIGDRSFRFTRSPAWTRPKQRGAGETRVQAHVLVEEHQGGAWVGLTNRLDEAGLLVGDLLGMTAGQFTQVAMLPQGRFQAFLRATSSERHAVLQKLFRTDRFEQVERWLVDRRGEARRASEAAAQQVHEVLHRIQEAAGVPLPEAWTVDLAGPAKTGQVASWSRELASSADAELTAAGAARDGAREALAEAERVVEEARRLHDLQEQAGSAAHQLVNLARRADELAGLAERLSGHRRSAPVAPLAARARDCRRTAERALARWQDTERAVGPLLTEPPSRTTLASLHEEAVSARAHAEAFRPRADELAATRSRRAGLEHRLDAVAESVAALDAAIADHPARLSAAQADLDDAKEATSQRPVLEQRVAALEALVLASRRHAAVVEELDTAIEDLSAARHATLTAYDTYLTVREARIEGMAAELAGSLAAGCACPVCGSASHPQPAHSTGSAVGRAEEEAARKAHEDAGFVQQAQEVRVATLTAERVTLDDRLAGAERGELPAELASARDRLRDARSLIADLDARAARLQAVHASLERARTARDRALVDQAAARQRHEAAHMLVDMLSAELDALLGDEAPDLDSLVARRAARCDALAVAIAAWAAYDEAGRAASEADRALEEASRAAGFAGAEAAAAALMSDESAREVETVLAEAEATRLAAEQALADPAKRAAASQPRPDLAVLVVRQRLAAEGVQAAASAHDAATARARRLRILAEQLGRRLEAWAPLRDQHALAAQLSQLVEGKGPDNPLRIRLAAYVLSERLRQVVAAANERLAGMTGQRYSLEHTDDRGAGEQRGGLSLRVRDDWNGVSRDPATLSGGETFVVSLALALGLADTVAHEAGGTDIDTLFIDEGFGSLDTDTLEDVMDTLDSLRDGGRVVGLVSHVPELRSRITTQLEVLKGRNGSTLRPVLAAG
ncbi:DNA repair protein SbcC/Rad50 [Marmoricola sp. URHA0025 HA25]